jgi:hypothetical protein
MFSSPSGIGDKQGFFDIGTVEIIPSMKCNFPNIIGQEIS